jgi:hypothetical protein
MLTCAELFKPSSTGTLTVTKTYCNDPQYLGSSASVNLSVS